MRALLERLHRARLTAGSLDTEVAEARRKFDEEQADLMARRVAATLEVDEATVAVRTAGIAAFRETGDLAPAPGIKIRMMNRLEYDESEALRWALVHKMGVQLDRAAFERLAKATPLDFVRQYQEPAATIATDLGPVLDGMADAAPP